MLEEKCCDSHKIHCSMRLITLKVSEVLGRLGGDELPTKKPGFLLVGVQQDLTSLWSGDLLSAVTVVRRSEMGRSL